MIYLTISGLENIAVDYRLILVIFGIIIFLIAIISILKFIRPVQLPVKDRIKLPSMTPIPLYDIKSQKSTTVVSQLNMLYNVEEPVEKENELVKLRDYIRTVMQMGYSEEEIKQIILSQGWSPVDSENLLKEEKKGMAMDVAKKYIKEGLLKGFTKFQIESAMKKRGWPSEMVRGLFREMNI